MAAGVRRGVVNAGINGNKVVSDSTCFGERATARFERDALRQPRVRTVIVLEGINDIGSPELPDFGCGPSTPLTAAQLIDGHRKLIRAAHRRGVTIVGCTLPPFKGSGPATTTSAPRRSGTRSTTGSAPAASTTRWSTWTGSSRIPPTRSG